MIAGLERLDLDECVGRRGRDDRADDDAGEHDVLHIPQGTIDARRNDELRDPQPARRRGDEFLQRAERAEPAAERAASPNDEGDQHEAPDQQRGRIVEEKAVIVAALGVTDDADERDDRQLRLRVPADETERGREIGHGRKSANARALATSAFCQTSTGTRIASMIATRTSSTQRDVHESTQVGPASGCSLTKRSAGRL